MNVDFGKTSEDYAKHRAGFPEAFFERLTHFNIGKPNQRVVDLGTGTGTVARGLARRGCIVTALDASSEQIAQATQITTEKTIQYGVAPAEKTGLPTASYDVVTAGQCWHWFDRPRAAQEARRILLSGGQLVIAHFNWIPLLGNLADATEKLMEAHNPQWKLGGATGIFPDWLSDVALAGFRELETFSFDVDVPYTHESWQGRIRASAAVGASLSAKGIARFDDDLKLLLDTHFPEVILKIPHRVWALVCKSP